MVGTDKTSCVVCVADKIIDKMGDSKWQFEPESEEKKLTAESGHAARRQGILAHSFPFPSCLLSSRCSYRPILPPPSTAQ